VGVLESRGEPDLPLEPVGAQVGSEIGVEDLEGDWPVVAEIARQVDRGHAAAAELPLDRIPVQQRLAKRRKRFGREALGGMSA